MFNLLRWLRGAANEASESRVPETRSERAGGRAGHHRSGAADTGSRDGTGADAANDEQLDQLRQLDGSDLADLLDEQLDARLAELRTAITAELDQFRERLDRAERNGRALTDEWQDALAKFAKIGNRLAAQARRDLEKASRDVGETPFGDEGQQSMFPNMVNAPLPPHGQQGPPRELTREERKAQLRRQLRGA